MKGCDLSSTLETKLMARGSEIEGDFTVKKIP
jgi:hypothetical protein